MDRDLRKELGPETETPRRNMGPGSQTESDIIETPPVDRQTPAKTLPYPKLRLWVVIISAMFH